MNYGFFYSLSDLEASNRWMMVVTFCACLLFYRLRLSQKLKSLRADKEKEKDLRKKM